MLTLEGVPVVKFWLHLPKKAERKRIKRFRKDPLLRWRVPKQAEKFFKHYDEFRAAAEHTFSITNADFAPWHVVEATDDRHQNLTVTTSLLEALREALDGVESVKNRSGSPRCRRGR